MAAAPATAAAALALLISATDRLVYQGFDLGQLVGATGDANCFLLTTNQGASPIAFFVSASTTTPNAATTAIAQKMRALGLTVCRYVAADTTLSFMTGVGSNGAWGSLLTVPTQDEWIAALVSLLPQETIS